MTPLRPTDFANLDVRKAGILRLLEDAPLDDVKSVLDIGVGRCELAMWLASRGKHVTGVGVAIHTYGVNFESLKARYGIDVREGRAEALEFPDGSFDAVLMSHVLEHSANVGTALAEARRVLRKGGLLMVLVPPHELAVAGGHLSMGWNVGQLLYVLRIAGFDVRDGMFCDYAHNICAFVRRSDEALPGLIYDEGDLAALNAAGLLPRPLGGPRENFLGPIYTLNWPNANVLIGGEPRRARRLVRALLGPLRLLPRKIRVRVAMLLFASGIELASEIEPQKLSGY